MVFMISIFILIAGITLMDKVNSFLLEDGLGRLPTIISIFLMFTVNYLITLLTVKIILFVIQYNL